MAQIKTKSDKPETINLSNHISSYLFEQTCGMHPELQNAPKTLISNLEKAQKQLRNWAFKGVTIK